jgi:para-nitrobenzyl esterase
MLRVAFTFLSGMALLMSARAHAQVVPVTGGAVRGSEWDGSHLFRGIPFAAPPVERLRWKPPQPVVPWKGLRDATAQPASSVQNNQDWNYSDYLIGK